MRDLTESIEDGAFTTQQLNMTAEDVERQFDLLDKQQLSGLISALEAAKRQSDALGDSLEDTVGNMRSELAALQGDLETVEKIKYEQRRADLEAQLEQAEYFRNEEAQKNAREALELLEQTYQLRQKQNAEREKESKLREAERQAREAERREYDESQDRQQYQRQERRTQEQTRDVVDSNQQTYRLVFATDTGQSLGSLDVISQADVERLVLALQRSGYVTGN